MDKEAEKFEEWVKDMHLRAGQIYRQLAKHDIRIFCVDLSTHSEPEIQYWIHDNKTTREWRQDIRFFIENCDMKDDEGWANNSVFNALGNHLRQLGYSEVSGVVADVFEGRISNHNAKLMHNPAHEEQPDGFGHYGWENKEKPES